MGNYSQGHICQCLTRLATQHRHTPVTISGDQRKTGQQFVQGVMNLANGLLRIGLRSGDVVAICAFNSDWYLEWLLAVAFVGGIVAPLNYRWSFEEARFAMLVVRPVMLVMDESSNNWLLELQNNGMPSLQWCVSLGSPASFSSKWNVLSAEALKEHSVGSLSTDYSWAPDGAVMICFTSGTTGRPKGVTISHSALIIQSLAKIAIAGYGETDVYFHTAPLCHIGGLSSAMAMLMVGACHVLIPKFDAKSALETIEKYKVTSFITVPAMMADIISLIRARETWKGSESVKKILNGGGCLSVELINDFIKFFPRTKLVSAYGMTETCSSLTFMTIYDPTPEIDVKPHQMLGKENSSSSVHKPQGVCVGKPAPHIELRICADGSSNVGRILTRGSHIMLRYWDQVPEKASNSGDGTWLDTGDIGSIDEHGNVWLIGRTNGRIKSGGENVYPEEVEAILLQHPGVDGIVVVGIPDARLTEMVVACVRIKDNWKWSDRSFGDSTKNEELLLSSEILQIFCKQKNLTRFKIPRMFIFRIKPFPLTTTGKIRRDQVRKEVMLQFQFLPSSL